MSRLNRRDYLKLSAASLAAGVTFESECFAQGRDVGAKPKSVAAVVTIYTPGSHSDVILGKILEGWKHDGGPGPDLKLASMYVDQFPSNDLARQMIDKYAVPIFDSIEKAVTVGSDTIPVDGVLSIGEHGDYPFNQLGQQMYPRRRFFSEISDTFKKYGRVVPVFNDKHLGPAWLDAKWMYDRASELKIPMMAGSSMPVGYRIHPIQVPANCEIEAAVGIGYSGLDIYGIHTLEFFQYHVEHRRGAERGVRWVEFLEGPRIWEAVDSGAISSELLEAATGILVGTEKPDVRKDDQAGVFLFEYTDGLPGAVFMLGCLRGTSIALKLKNHKEPLVTGFDERTMPRYPHFAFLLKAIERMIHTGQPTYPVERTLLTSGILDRALTSRHRSGMRLETPELAIAYRPVHYPHAHDVDLLLRPPMKS